MTCKILKYYALKQFFLGGGEKKLKINRLLSCKKKVKTV